MIVREVYRGEGVRQKMGRGGRAVHIGGCQDLAPPSVRSGSKVVGSGIEGRRERNASEKKRWGRPSNTDNLAGAAIVVCTRKG